jgi:hypothetical protein
MKYYSVSIRTCKIGYLRLVGGLVTNFQKSVMLCDGVEASHVNYCGGKMEAVKDKPWIHSIADFREHMRAAKAAGK